MCSFRLTTSEQLLNAIVKESKSHRGWRNISGLEAHPGQRLGQLHRIHPAVRGHVRLTPDVHVHFTDCRGEKGTTLREDPGQRMQRRRMLTSSTTPTEGLYG